MKKELLSALFGIILCLVIVIVIILDYSQRLNVAKKTCDEAVVAVREEGERCLTAMKKCEKSYEKLEKTLK